jgi:hypothetical protein
MGKDDSYLLEVLRFELLFLQRGGYGRLRSQGVSRRAPLIFEDSPICMNYDAREDRTVQRVLVDAIRSCGAAV